MRVRVPLLVALLCATLAAPAEAVVCASSVAQPAPEQQRTPKAKAKKKAKPKNKARSHKKTSRAHKKLARSNKKSPRTHKKPARRCTRKRGHRCAKQPGTSSPRATGRRSAAPAPTAGPSTAVPSASTPASSPSTACAADTSTTAPAETWPRAFAGSSPWNRRIADDAPVASNSPALVASLVEQSLRYTPWVNTTTFSSPVYRVGADVPLVSVKMDKWSPTLTSQFAAVPLPENAQPPLDTDRHLIVWQASTDTLWEFWQLWRKADGWHAMWGGKMDHISTAPGIFPYPFGVSASGNSLLGGLITPDEIRKGDIPHAVALGIPDTASDTFTPPANRTDGRTALGGIPMGTRFRLDPRVDVRSLHLPWAAGVIAQAAQRYGIIINDSTHGSLSFYGEDPVTMGSNPWPELFEGRSPSQMLARFPWALLQVVDPSVSG
jgi:hypothetical protein